MTHTNKFDLMIWETNPSKRNVNNEIKFYIDSNVELQIGDILEANRKSSYKILDIKNRRIGAVRNRDYVTSTIKWFNATT